MTDEPISRPRNAAATRAAILEAARERFATDGYERATIRAIAADARIDPALVIRYFGNKEKLFAAAAEFDLELPRLPELSGLAPSVVAAAMVEHFIVRWERDDVLLALLRSAMTHTAAAERMQAIFAGQLIPRVAALTGEPPETAALRASLVSSQALGMALCRYALRLPPLVAMTREEVVAWLAPTVERYLFAPHPAV